MKNIIYMDNAATSFPKPPEVTRAMVHFMEEVGGNPGRSGHVLALEAERIVSETRGRLAKLFAILDPSRIVFTANATESLNTVIYGYLKPGDHVIATGMEHNSVMRPLRHLEQTGTISLSIAPCDKLGRLDIESLPGLIRNNTALMVLNHASNVCGTIQDISAVKRAIGDIPLLLDAAQTAGVYPIDVEAEGIDFLAFTGHKGLLGPQGIGGLYIREGLEVRPLKRGGTGSISEREEQPDFFPDAFESGTLNTVGIAGLGAGVGFILERGVESIRAHEMDLLTAFIDGLSDVLGITSYGLLDSELQTAILSITFDSALPPELHHTFGGCGGVALPATFESVLPSEAGQSLKEQFHILVRTGLHCAPMAHKTLGSFPDGTVRFSMGYFNTLEHVSYAVKAVKEIAQR
ncbi:MAG: aminotransferase class V-fold PLP-dependent enzyme [Deltaproteobacteria bacterium]|nr:aminotransferase class V-fold PLP-dependent enzyme [Deltaproteobacteria bacterium]